MRKHRLFVLIVAVCMAAGLVYTASAAAKKPVRSASPGLLVVSPSTPQVGDTVTFSGCGYTPGSSVTIIVYSPSAAAFFGAATDSNGCFDTEPTENYTADEAGSYEADSYQVGLLVATVHFATG
jgi:hypothetical protein